MKDIKKILIVCTGNSCRSIMAEGYLKKRLKEEGFDKIEVSSAGTGAFPGLRPTPETIEVMNSAGVDVSGYGSSSLNRPEILNADAVLVMQPRHSEHVLNLAPEAKDKVYLLRDFKKEMIKTNHDIEDPIGKPLEFYKKVFNTIKESIEGFITWLKE